MQPPTCRAVKSTQPQRALPTQDAVNTQKISGNTDVETGRKMLLRVVLQRRCGNGGLLKQETTDGGHAS